MFYISIKFPISRDSEERIQVRMSAIMVSQNESSIVDLLSPFNPDPRHRVVKIVDDARTGVFIDNESEIRVETIDQALFYLNTAVDHRMIRELKHDLNVLYTSFRRRAYPSNKPRVHITKLVFV